LPIWHTFKRQLRLPFCLAASHQLKYRLKIIIKI
jgi:hypothetical protein